MTDTGNRTDITRYGAAQGARLPNLSGDDRRDLTGLRIERDAKALPRPASRGYRKGLFYSVVIFGTIAVGFLLHGWILNSSPSVETGTVTMAYPSQAFTLLNATGYVVPRIKADVASKATGRLQSLEVEEGAYVKKGQIIGRLENQDVIADMEQAEANVGVAQADLKQAEEESNDSRRALTRAKNLIGKKYISESAFDEAVARLNKALAAENSAKAKLVAADAAFKGAKVAVEYTLIRAPFDGVILTKQANVGDIVAPFSSAVSSKGAVVTLADMDTLEVETDVSESNFSNVALGQPCEVELSAIPDERFRCVVDRIVPTVDRSKATVLVRVRFVDRSNRILPNMSAKVAFLSKEVPPDLREPVTVVHRSAIVTRHGTQVAFRVQGDTVVETPVMTGEGIGETVTIEQGLQPGDTVVLSPPQGLQHGSTFRARQT